MSTFSPIIWIHCPRIRFAVTLDQIGGHTDRRTLQRSRRCQVAVRRADSQGGRWLFDVVSTGPERSGGPYRVRVRISPRTRNPDSSKLGDKDIEVSCSCPAWRFWGSDYWSKARRYLWRPSDSIPNMFPDWPKPGRGYSDGSFPDVRDPQGSRGSCKHVAAVLRLMRGYWAPSGGEKKPGERQPFKVQHPGASARVFWSKLGISDMRAYLADRYEGTFTDIEMADATAEALNEWYDEPEAFERVRTSVRPAQDDIMFDDVLRDIGRSVRRKTRFLEMFEDEIAAGRAPMEEAAEEEEDEGEGIGPDIGSERG